MSQFRLKKSSEDLPKLINIFLGIFVAQLENLGSLNILLYYPTISCRKCEKKSTEKIEISQITKSPIRKYKYK